MPIAGGGILGVECRTGEMWAASIIEIGGAYFPAWLLCAAGALVGAAVVRGVLAAAGWDGAVRPRMLAYPSLAV